MTSLLNGEIQNIVIIAESSVGQCCSRDWSSLSQDRETKSFKRKKQKGSHRQSLIFKRHIWYKNCNVDDPELVSALFKALRN